MSLRGDFRSGLACHRTPLASFSGPNSVLSCPCAVLASVDRAFVVAAFLSHLLLLLPSFGPLGFALNTLARLPMFEDGLRGKPFSSLHIVIWLSLKLSALRMAQSGYNRCSASLSTPERSQGAP